MNRYVIIYEVKSKTSGQVLEENSAIHASTSRKFSLLEVKNKLLEAHGFKSDENYIRVLNVCNLGPSINENANYGQSSWSVLGD